MFPADLPQSLGFDPAEPLADFCLWPYPPLVRRAGLLKSEAVLWASSHLTPHGDLLRRLVADFRRELGPGQTVWGVKNAAGRLTYEFYFYDYARQDRRVTLERVLGTFAPYAPTPLTFPASRPFFMFSIDIDPEGLAEHRPIDEISLYFGNPSDDLSSGLCYKLRAEGVSFANLYHFFHTREHASAIGRKLEASAFLDAPARQFSDLLAPDRLGLITVIANKRNGDGLYYSRVRAQQMAAFVARYRFPPPFVAFIHEHLAGLEHLYFDLGLDYVIVEGQVQVTKTAVYGVV